MIHDGSSLIENELDSQIRRAAMAWLDQRCTEDNPLVRRDELLNDFYFEGTRLPLVDPNRGIRKPRSMVAALSILTTFTPPGRRSPYEDAPARDGLLRYKYRGEDPQQPDNIALRRAYQWKLPLIWFYGVATGIYLPRYPVWLVGDEPQHLQFAVALDQAQLFIPHNAELDGDQRRYVERLTRQRLHQPVFRERVLQAYEKSCAMCHLRHVQLLDAAHILRDSHPQGIPAVSNGLALCKIHHAAYDKNVLGIRPDHIVEVRADVLEEIDGPMLRYGLQEMNGLSLSLPRSRRDWPDAGALEERYEEFRLTA
ncbi:HNH endonuclease [Microbispora sp. H10885]|uniref:HNH endonuclease n=1 Tax=Microbispora sp. H10885 TaxID=2729110 RepID=UPI001C7253F8|nr:HNH endonuclease [Microbispora sp. H10885]